MRSAILSSLVISMVLFTHGAVWAQPQTNKYMFLPGQSTVVQTGGFAGINETHTIEGQFQLTVDFDANTASFDQVDATLSESVYLPTQDLGELFQMTELVSTDVNEIAIDFEDTNPPIGGIDINIRLSFMGDLIRLTGRRIEPWPDGFQYDLDAIALYIPVTYYVDAVYGNDNNDGLTPETAFATIQKGINEAFDGDTVVVQQGTYTGDGNRDIDFLGKAITVRSTDPNDPNIVAATIVDCNGTEAEPHRGFYFHNNEDTNSVLKGFTITNGYLVTNADAGGGAGIYCFDSSPTISNCIITANTAQLDGTDSICYGGGIAIRGPNDSSPTITNCVISNNASVNFGFGGGISCRGGSPTITNCVFNGNYADERGGGMYNDDGSDPTTNNCIFSGNRANNWGGAIYCFKATIVNCTFSDNTADYGGAICCDEYLPNFQTFIVNCILWGDNATYSGSEIAMICWDWGSELSVSYSDIEAGQAGVAYNPATCTLNWGPGNIDADPCFVQLGSWPEVIGDYHLLSERGRYWPQHDVWVLDNVTSPCIDGGDPNVNPSNEPMPNGARINMGAYGNTAYASMSEWPTKGDINLDGVVNMIDLAILADDWLEGTTPIGPPDLAINEDDITFSNPNPVSGEEIAINVTVYNIGDADAGEFVVYFAASSSVDGIHWTLPIPLDWVTVPHLSASSSVVVSINASFPCCMSNIMVVVDNENQIQEANETNNYASKLLVIEQ